ncbi:aldo/keto reductase [Rathayibacter iranicus]|uniref:Aldo/keto reductase n=2 Tax=Rathayibacter iranicus TaxID=59737 RepID=A0AAD1AC84_9MICO|nr:aldo/keto reductase [Rathayibacter iranicus]AZZ54730.1 aldo/keto reductase [Rathayibacter iranicus]MWV30520.1 aldo/keto reductase [Rathayibacter iranicus NCPPB 2253 = VKM Ac-1602]PPI50987.1 oxidoreductase [Rathayibacter iranicus]PPI62927.1 oxidoreductase [Rathayibacter iranicus]PPI74219.1 oxidoreductase [Rathayibacter iranicus]
MPRVKSGAAVRALHHGALPSTTWPVETAVVAQTHRRPLGESEHALFPLILDVSAVGREGGAALLERFAAWGGNGVVVTDSASSVAAETEAGSWLAGHRDRDRFLLIGRFGAPEGAAATPRLLVTRIEDVLRRLRTDRLDVLAVRPDGAGRLDELLSAAEVLLSRGLVRTVVASGFAAEQLFEARVLAAHGLPRFCAVEVRYNLLEQQEAEGDLGLVAAGQGLSLLSSVPLAHGFLRGVERTKRDLGRLPEGALAAAYIGRRGRRMLAALDAIGSELSAAPAAVALAWLLARPHLAAATVAPRSPAEVDALVRAVSLDLDAGHVAALDRARR